MDKPSYFEVTTAALDALSVTWSAVPDATSYLTQVRHGSELIDELVVLTPELYVGNLVNDTLYQLTVTALNGEENSGPAHHPMVMDLRNWIGMAEELTWQVITDTSKYLQFTWDPADHADDYQVLVQNMASGVVTTLTETSPFNLLTPIPGDVYRIVVTPRYAGHLGIAVETMAWIEVPLDGRSEVSTAMKLTPSLLQADATLLYREFIQNMRPLRDDARYWRLTDLIAFAHDQSGELWRARVQENGIYLSSVDDLDSVDTTPLLLDVTTVDSVSLEFDDESRPIIAYETGGNVYLYHHHDDVDGYEDHFNGLGITPIVCAVPDWNDEMLFSLDTTLNEIQYWFLSDDMATARSIPSPGGQILEILQAGVSNLGDSDGTARAIVVVCAMRTHTGIAGKTQVVLKSFSVPYDTGDTTIDYDEFYRNQDNELHARTLGGVLETMYPLDVTLNNRGRHRIRTPIRITERALIDPKTNMSMADMFSTDSYGQKGLLFEGLWGQPRSFCLVNWNTGSVARVSGLKRLVGFMADFTMDDFRVNRGMDGWATVFFGDLFDFATSGNTADLLIKPDAISLSSGVFRIVGDFVIGTPVLYAGTTVLARASKEGLQSILTGFVTDTHALPIRVPDLSFHTIEYTENTQGFRALSMPEHLDRAMNQNWPAPLEQSA